MAPSVPVERVDDTRWRIPRRGGMRVDGVVFASERLMAPIREDPCLEQVCNVAHLPGILNASMAMPDIHWGYGFPIGGVAAFDTHDGVISPGGVGYDINCGVRLVRTNLREEDVRPQLEELVVALFQAVPSGVGSRRKDFRLGKADMRRVAERGAAWAVAEGFGSRDDLDHIEAGGALEGADFAAVGDRAFQRGRDQLGTLGSGNHFVEIQVVREILDERAAAAFGLAEGQITLSIHTGSRGFGYQICSDAVHTMRKAVQTYGIDIPDPQLCCAPIRSPEGRQYFAAMAAAANFAFANRQIIAARVADALADRLRESPEGLGLRTVYDVAHNIAKFERHVVAGEERTVCVHRKGATRALPPGHAELPADYRDVGQPVFIPGDMGRRSFVLAGSGAGNAETFASSCHGAGRVLSRKAALKRVRGSDLVQQLAREGIIVRAAGLRTIAEEAPVAYKDVGDVVDTVHRAGIARKVAELRPLGVVKG